MREPNQERRKFIRVSESLLIRYNVVDSPKDNQESVTKNVSGGGIKIPLREELAVGTKLKLEMELLREKKEIKLEGKVVWVKSQPKDSGYPYEMGVEFVGLSMGTRTMLSNHVQYLNRHQLLEGYKD